MDYTVVHLHNLHFVAYGLLTIKGKDEKHGLQLRIMHLNAPKRMEYSHSRNLVLVVHISYDGFLVASLPSYANNHISRQDQRIMNY
jgi:hypothetical protein